MTTVDGADCPKRNYTRRWVYIIHLPESAEIITTMWSDLKVGGLSPLDFFISSFLHAVADAEVNILFPSSTCKNVVSKNSFYIQNGIVNVVDESKSLQGAPLLINSADQKEIEETTSNKLTICFSLRYYPMWENTPFSLSTFLDWIENNHRPEHALIVASPTSSNTMVIAFDSSSNISTPILGLASLTAIQEFFTSHNSVTVRTVTAPLDVTFHDLTSAEDIRLVDDVHRSSFGKTMSSFPLLVREKCPARVGLMVFHYGCTYYWILSLYLNVCMYRMQIRLSMHCILSI